VAAQLQSARLTFGMLGRTQVMAEVLMDFDVTIVSRGVSYRPRAIGRRATDGMWEGWLEFLPEHAAASEESKIPEMAVVGGVESRQPEREYLMYWATGLSPVYLEGALERALQPLVVRERVAGPPLSQAPAPRRVHFESRASKPQPLLDPFEIGGRNLDQLRQELGALNRPRLKNIITAYDLNPGNEDIEWMSDAQLVHFIVVAVDAQLPQRARSS
jgi:hypothetical protein